MSKVTVFGAGAWGSTMAQVLSDAGNEVLLWGRSESVITEITTAHTNVKYLGSHVLPDNIIATTSLDDAFTFSQMYVLAIPAQEIRATLEDWKARFTISPANIIVIVPPLLLSQTVLNHRHFYTPFSRFLFYSAY